ncbi:MAG: hypothetical protein WC586_04035 [Methanoregula sp.]
MKICPHCGNEIFCLDMNCPYCKRPIVGHFTILSFLKENFQYFTIIGIIGTMISLLPNLGEKYWGSDWLAGDLGYFAIFLSLVTLFGALLITALFVIIILKILECRKNERFKPFPVLNRFSDNKWYAGDFQRFILLIIIVPMMIGFIIFLWGCGSFIPSPYSLIFAMFFLLIVMCIIYSIIAYSMGQQANRITEEYGRRIGTIFIILTLALYVILFLFVTPGILVGQSYSSNIQIIPDQMYFSPSATSPEGIRLEVTNISGNEQIMYTSYNWSTNYGYFVQVSLPTNKVYILGDHFQSQSDKIYWTFSQQDLGVEKPPVEIKLQVKNLKDNSFVTNTSLNLTWFKKDIAFVNYSYDHENILSNQS